MSRPRPARPVGGRRPRAQAVAAGFVVLVLTGLPQVAWADSDKAQDLPDGVRPVLVPAHLPLAAGVPGVAGDSITADAPVEASRPREVLAGPRVAQAAPPSPAPSDSSMAAAAGVPRWAVLALGVLGCAAGALVLIMRWPRGPGGRPDPRSGTEPRPPGDEGQR